jgi:DNA-binding beta-propeller fold protein YncE
MKSNPKRLRRNCLRIVLLVTALGLFSASATGHPGAGIAVDRAGQIYFLDTGSGLWKRDKTGKLTHLSRTLFHWLAIDEDDCFANTQFQSGARGEIIKVGTNPTVLLSSDYPIAIGKDGNLYYPSGAAGSLRLMKMSPAGVSSLVLAFPATASGKPLPHIGGIIGAPDGSLLYTEDGAVRKIDSQGNVSTVAAVRAQASPPSIPGMTEHPYLRGLALTDRGVIYVADTGDASLLRITSDGKVVTTILRAQSPWSPTAVAVFGNDVYVLEFLHTASDVRREWSPRIRKVAPNGTSSLIVTLEQMPGAR